MKFNLEKKDGNKHLQDFIQKYATSLRQQMISINSLNNGNYNPQLGQEYQQEINTSTRVPTQSELTEWLRRPYDNQKSLRDVSRFLSNSVMQYHRSKKHFASIMNYRYELTACDIPEKDEEESFMNAYGRCLDILKRLNVQYQFENITWSTMDDGAKFYFLRETEHFMTLTELPNDYCYITGTWDLGFTYAIDLSYFDRHAYLKDQIPEFSQAYEIFIKMRELSYRGLELLPYQYYPVPIEKGFVFTFDPIHAEATPPLKGTFKDAFEIVGYKNLLKQRTTLDTWKMIAQKIPYDEKNEKFIVEYEEASQIVNMIQRIMPPGAKTFATFFEPHEISFNQAQNMNNITGLGEQLYWSSLGVAGNIFGMDNKTGLGLQLSLESDMGFIDHLYRQFENFINWQFLLTSREFRFQVKFMGNRYTKLDEIKTYKDIVLSTNMPVSRVFALAGYEPFEIDATINLENILKRKSKMKPIIAGAQMSGKNKGGRPESSQGELGDAGEITRDYDSNSSKS